MTMLRISLLGLSTAIVVCAAAVVSWAQHTYSPPAGFVPDQRTAIRIAKAVLAPVYGEAKIESEEPFTAILKGDVWMIEGHLPEGYSGGVALVEISKSDARILRMTHGK